MKTEYSFGNLYHQCLCIDGNLQVLQTTSNGKPIHLLLPEIDILKP
jgi:hypothetical protein